MGEDEDKDSENCYRLDGVPISRISEIITLTSIFARTQDRHGLDEHLALLDLENLAVTEMIAYSRSTYVMRSKLPAWEGMVYRMTELLKISKPNTYNQLMQGLI